MSNALSDVTIKALEKIGFKRWQSYGKNRLYIKATDLGLNCSYYGTGNIASATWLGEHISNSKASKMAAVKTYVDVETGEVESTNSDLWYEAKKLVEQHTDDKAILLAERERLMTRIAEIDQQLTQYEYLTCPFLFSYI